MTDVRRGRVVTEEYLQYVERIVDTRAVPEKIAEIIESNNTIDAANAIFEIMKRLSELERPQNPLGRTATFEQNANRAIDETCEKHFG